MLLKEIKNSNPYLGNKNSQFGTSWVRKDGKAKKISSDLLDTYLSDGWLKGRIEPKSAEQKTALQQLAYAKRKKFSNTCANCGKEFLGSKNQKNCSKECSKWQSGKNAAISMKNNGTHAGWHSRKGESSYPEKYFENLFNTENITGWSREKKVGRWFIDFAFESKKIAVEIDGRQHQDLERANSDKLKDEFLINNGWKVFRIIWVNPINDSNKEKLYIQIERLKKILK